VFESSLDAVVVMDATGIVRDWNPAAEQIFGYARADAVGCELAELIIPGPLRETHRNALARYVQTGEGTIFERRIELSALRRGGEEFPVELTVTRISSASEMLFCGFVRDMGEPDSAKRENARLQKRMAFLAEAGLVLEGSLDIDETLHRLAELTVPELAELTVIDLLHSATDLRMAVAAAVTPEVAHELVEARRREPLRLDSKHPVAQVLSTGSPLLLESMSPEFHADIAQGPKHLEVIRRLGYRSAIVVPLVARQRVLGALSLLRMHTPEPYRGDDLVLALELARRAALAVDNSRLFGAMRHLAQTLQQTLLPRSIPQIPGTRIAARYSAAAEGQEVGGDFYDVFEIEPGHWGIAIGDVCGKGPEAAARTSMARYTVRALAGHDPGAVLGLLNDALTVSTAALPERFLTLAFAVAQWEKNRLRLEVASAGHPPALVRRADGRLETVAASGLLLGLAREVSYSSKSVVLEAGDSLILYTDGLTDARAPETVLSEDDLAALVQRSQGLRGAELADFLERAATAGAQPRDDIALLIVDVVADPVDPGTAPPRVHVASAA
jgi:PAS domain S-box-containing protein